MAAAPLGIPVVMWDGNVIPGRAVRATARLATALAVSFEATCRSIRVATPNRPCYVTGTPIREVDAIGRAAARVRMDIAPDERVMLIFGGSQAVRRFNAAVAEALPRLVERVTVIHVTGDEGYAAALAGREALPETARRRYRPYPFLRDEMLPALVAADLVVGRAGASTLAEVTALGLPMVVVPYPHAAGHQRANAASLVEAGAARLVADEAFDAAALVDAAGILDDPVAYAAMSAAARSLGRPGAADAVADLVLAAAAREPLPDPAVIERSRARCAGHDRGLRRDRDRHGHPAPDRGQDVARRAAGQVHDDARRRPGRPVRDGPQRPRAARPGPVRADARPAAPRPRAGERPGHRRRRRARPGHPGPGRGVADGRRALHRRGRRPDGARRDRDAAGRPDRSRVRPGHPGHRRRRRLGERRRPRRGRRRASSNRPGSSPPTAPRRSSSPPTSASATARAGSRRAAPRPFPERRARSSSTPRSTSRAPTRS